MKLRFINLFAVFGIVLGIFGFCGLVHATTSNVDVPGSMTVVNPVVITKIRDLNFATIYFNRARATTVTLTPLGAILASPAGTQLIGSPTTAQFNLSGDANTAMTLAITGTTLVAGSTNLSATYQLSTTSMSLNSSGTAKVTVGSVLTIPVNTPSGTYTGTITLTANY
ncbi:putative DUF4402 domain-containing protein [Candidatus Hepatincolaceae symbiont of Richtersius coronifer]